MLFLLMRVANSWFRFRGLKIVFMVDGKIRFLFCYYELVVSCFVDCVVLCDCSVLR